MYVPASSEAAKGRRVRPWVVGAEAIRIGEFLELLLVGAALDATLVGLEAATSLGVVIFPFSFGWTCLEEGWGNASAVGFRVAAISAVEGEVAEAVAGAEAEPLDEDCG
jgi:hypothetical protein